MTEIENKLERVFEQMEELRRKLYLLNEEIASIKQEIKQMKER